jgi:hypothetical protein
MSTSKWVQDIEETFVNTRLSSVQIRTFRPDRLMKMAHHVETFEDQCSTCKKLRMDIDRSLEPLKQKAKITEPVLHQYMVVFRKLSNHLKSDHHLVLPFYFSSMYTLWGLFAGVLIWLVFWWIYNHLAETPIPLKIGLLIMAVIGMFTGRVLGHKKDMKLYKNRLY